MTRMHLSRAGLIMAAVLLVLSAPLASARQRETDKLPPVTIQDLHYGDVLFHYWSDDDGGLETLTRLEAYSQWHRMPHHAADAQLLAAGLYLQLGMHNEAGTQFETLLAGHFTPAVRNKAWFYLAKIWYDRGYDDRTLTALSHIQGTLGEDQEGERTQMQVNALMHLQRYDEAITVLRRWRGPADWMAYARFNLGVALVRSHRLADADPILTSVGLLNTTSSELLNLRDKANLALGFAYLQADNPRQSLPALSRVRLDGPYSSRALLGAGWAHAAEGDYQGALAPWLELRKRSVMDAAVQESYLAVPYAYSQLKASAQSAEFYESALKSFADESQLLDGAIADINAGHLLDSLLAAGQEQNRDGTVNTAADQPGWFWQLKQLPDSPQSRYLYTLLADNDFQEGLKNVRDLSFLRHSLSHWDEDMDDFAAMIDTRQRAYAERLPRADAMLASDAPTHLRAERAAIDTRLNMIETVNDVAALGTPEERDQWARIAKLEERVNALPAGSDRDQAADALRLIKGTLYWRLDASFRERAYKERRSLKQLDASLEELQNRWVRVQRARATVPSNNGEFADRIAALAARIQNVHTSLDSSAQAQSDFLSNLAVSELRSQQERLDAYSVEARFHLADIYDRSADQGRKSSAGSDAPDNAAPIAAPGQQDSTPAPVPAPDTNAPTAVPTPAPAAP